MKKLTLESLEVTSFETAPVSALRGTVRANDAQPVSKANCASILAPCYPTDPNFDCTYGCSRDTGCPDQCVVISADPCI
jgi:hypothetical protein